MESDTLPGDIHPILRFDVCFAVYRLCRGAFVDPIAIASFSSTCCYHSTEQALMDMEPNTYADLVASNVPVDGPIEEDVPRTMYDHEMFCNKSRVNGKNMLRRVLTAYGRYDRQVKFGRGLVGFAVYRLLTSV